MWEGSDAEPHRTWARGVSEALAAEASPGGYVNGVFRATPLPVSSMARG